MGNKEDIQNNTIPCDVCGERYKLKANEGIYPSICRSCKEKEYDNAKDVYLKGLKEMTIEDRIARLEELSYDERAF